MNISVPPYASSRARPAWSSSRAAPSVSPHSCTTPTSCRPAARSRSLPAATSTRPCWPRWSANERQPRIRACSPGERGDGVACLRELLARMKRATRCGLRSPASGRARRRDDLLNLGASLRSLRRGADISQRELATAAGVPASTVARIESGRSTDPKFRTVERLVRPAGGALVVSGQGDPPPPVPVACHPAEDLFNGRERHYPAHLDVRPVVAAQDWWGAWWASSYTLPRARWPRVAPQHTYDLRRDRRAARRWRAEARRMIATAQVTRVGDWQWAVRLPDGATLGVLVAEPGEGRVQIVHLEVPRAWRALGGGRRLLAALYAEMRQSGRPHVHAVVERGSVARYLSTQGFRREWPQPLRLSRRLAWVHPQQVEDPG